MTRRFKLLVFDWDGTLMDSELRIVNCMRAVIEELNAPSRSDEEIRNVIGLGLIQAIETLFPDEERVLIDSIARNYRYRYLESDGTPSPLFPGARQVLESLRDQGFLLAVATGKARVGLDRMLRMSDLVGLFHISRCADETLSKPHSQMLQEIIQELGVGAHETLMIGDTEYDMQMSLNAGTRALAVAYGVHALSRLLEQHPLGHIDAIEELPSWLENYEFALH